MRASMSLQTPCAPSSLCSVGRSILAAGGNPFALGQAFAEHAEVCAVCGIDGFAPMNDDSEANA